MENIENCSQYDKILDTVLSGRHILLHGPGGVGKSYTLRYLAKTLRSEFGKNVYITATTGVAAVNLSDMSRGLSVTTLHRFAGVGTAELDVNGLVSKIKSKHQSLKRWKKCQILIIDETSMLGGGLFQKLDSTGKIIRGNLEPFGGIQLILSGDFLQLPPVKDNFLFLSQAYQDLNIRPFILEKAYRYDNLDFFELLSRVRMGVPSQEDIKILRARGRAHLKMQDLLLTLTNEKAGEVIKPTMSYSKRADVDFFNHRELEKLEGDLITFNCVDTFTNKKGSANQEEYFRLLDDAIPRSIQFKVGAQVMLKQNLDVDNCLVNGSRGVVSEIIKDEALIVKFLNGTKLRVDLGQWEIEDKYAKAKRVQIPFVLAWASTIHKLQSTTLDFVIADLGPSIFSPGQAYVALSRCRNIEGLFISEFIPSCIQADKEALKYVNTLKGKVEKEDFISL
jgi:ATP-dependent DNA helicase PIF1